jgi:hypothetical protein
MARTGKFGVIYRIAKDRSTDALEQVESMQCLFDDD